MYLATHRKSGRTTYRLRESITSGGRISCRELYNLGEDPTDFIVFPGGNSFYFEHRLISSLADLGVPDVDRQLEELLLPWLPADIQRIIIQMTKFKRKKRLGLSQEALARSQARLHILDRRRLYFLRFGRMDSPKAVMRPHKFLNVLLGKCRDEIEHHFQRLELKLRLRERKNYVYQVFDLARHFPGDLARLFPMGLDQEELDRIFLNELCQLNRDSTFFDHRAETNGPQPLGGESLNEYLVNYAIMWFDFEFVQKSPQSRFFEEFIRARAGYRPPPPPSTAFALDEACLIFSLSKEEWRLADRNELTRIYRRLALECHPDHGGDQEKFIKLNQAYERLISGK